MAKTARGGSGAHRGLSAHDLAKIAVLAPSYLSEIETGKKRGSFDAVARLALALGVATEELAPANAWTRRDSNGP